MRVFFSAGEASGDAYAAALVKAIRGLMDEDRVTAVRQAIFQTARDWIRLPPGAEIGDKEVKEVLEMLNDPGTIDLEEEEWSLPIDEVAKRILQPIGDGPLPEWILKFEGIGGRRLRAVANGRVLDSSRWGAISISQVLLMAPRFIVGYIRAWSRLSEGKPGLFIPIDFGYFNIRLCKAAKRRGWKVLYFVPPGSWRRDKQGKDLPLITDAIVTPFSWSAEILRKMGANAHFFGHPIKELMVEHDMPVTPVGTLAVLPGSRHREIERNLPLVAETIVGMPARQLEFAVAPTADLAEMRATWERLAPGRNDLFTENDVYGVLRRARAAIVCSGTATLEAALVRCPMIVIYRVTKAMKRESRLVGFKMPKFISLPNILLDRQVVPEFVCEEIDAAPLREALAGILSDDAVRSRQIQGFDEIDTLLGPADAITQTAKLAIEMLSSP